MAEVPGTPQRKDGWEKAKVILEPVGGLLTALAVAGLGYYGSRVLEQRQTIDSNSRLYSELMSKREESESALRKDMFNSIIGSFLQRGGESGSLDSRILNLELLTQNFHESLDLKPLFLHLERQVSKIKIPAEHDDYLNRLETVARDVTRKQMWVLEEAGKKFERRIDLDSLRNNPGGIELDNDTLAVDEIKRDFRIVALQADPRSKNVKIRLEVRTLGDSSQAAPEANVVEFWVGFFDFPMIDNIRLSHDQRCSVVLTEYEDDSADITILEFPGSHASLKEKPYFEEILHNLQEHTGK
ncbi:MAG TPA: hypothetical protein VES59_03325 [Bacteroidota bacterium]|nr:hypothetical protein [Bacteroidota bacterium]